MKPAVRQTARPKVKNKHQWKFILLPAAKDEKSQFPSRT
jgi:hypothetical protein